MWRAGFGRWRNWWSVPPDDYAVMEGHPKATRAYAWSSPIENSDKRRFYAVLHLGGIRSPVDAVRAAIVAERRAAP